MVRHLRNLGDVTPAEVTRIVDLAIEMKKSPKDFRKSLDGKSIGLIFAKQSTRTRVSFEVGCYQLGAQALVLSTGGGTGMQMGRGETVEDTAKVLSRFLDAIVIRTYGQDQVDGLAAHGSIPIVNALTDLYHPCQALADAQTIREHFGTTKGKKLVFVGAGNNVAHSLMLLGPRTGMDITIACPTTLPPNAYVFERALKDAKEFGTKVEIETDCEKAVKNADVIYSDTWVSMGEEDKAEQLMELLNPYKVTRELMKATGKKGAKFMHCLPAHRGDEVTADVMDSETSIVFDQAENRLHAQKALLALLLGGAAWK